MNTRLGQVMFRATKKGFENTLLSTDSVRYINHVGNVKSRRRVLMANNFHVSHSILKTVPFQKNEGEFRPTNCEISFQTMRQRNFCETQPI